MSWGQDARTGGIRLPVALVTCGVRAPAGQLTRAAWRVLEEADLVGASEAVQQHADAVSTERPVAPDDLDTLRRRAGSIAWLCTPPEGQELAAGGRGIQVIGAEDPPCAAVLELVEVMNRLRSPGGCPWDAEQTHATLAPYAVEEAFELAEAIQGGDRDELVDELGDVLLQVVFHARVAAEGEQPFDLDEVATRIVTKLRRRHPHVFSDVHAPSAAHVEANWEAIKAAEKPERTGILDGIPAGLPPLERAAKVASRLRRAGRTDQLSYALGKLPDDAGSRLLALAVGSALRGGDPGSQLRAALRELEIHLASESR